MGHHYVPKFYLRGFADNDKIWVHDRKENRSFLSQPKSVANETGMYPDDLERVLEQEVERPAMQGIEKVASRLSINPEDREALAKYMVFLWRRVPRGRQRVAEHTPKVADEVKAEILGAIEELSKSDPSLEEIAALRRLQVEDIISRVKENPPHELWHKGLMDHGSTRLIDSLLSMNWRFIYTKRHQFMTCDNPLFFFESTGIGHPQSEVTLPFSSQVALWATRRATSEGQYIEAPTSMVKEINRRTAYNATRFVYSKSNESWMLPFVKKENHEISVLPELKL